MTKPELGTKRLCAHCVAKFYDLHHSPSTWPKCGGVFETTGASPRSSTKAAPEAVPKVEPVLAEIPEAQLVSLEEDDPEGEQGLGAAAELEDVVALDAGRSSPGGSPYGRGDIDPDPTKPGLEVEITIDDPAVFTTPWSGLATYGHVRGEWP